MFDAEAAPGPSHAHPRWLRAALIVLAAFRTVLYVGILPLLVFSFFSDDHSDKVSWPMTGKLVVAPFMAGAALYLAVRARLPWAIVLLAALNLVEWAAELLRLLPHDLLTLNSLDSISQSVLAPLLALIAIVLALRGRFLALAAVLVGLPFVVLLIEVGGFAVGTAIYGR